ncbi:MAG: hypothetical protein FWC91_14435, partial [Defluviitaleaceae bacterium]|nr:hypothetical protein [Defluviitaleaceae bacterium]
SGNSPESVGAVEYARKIVKDLYEIAIVCDGESRLSAITKESDKSLLLVMPEGTNDKGFAMTSSVSCMIIAGWAAFNADEIDLISVDLDKLANQVENNSRKMAEVAGTCASWGAERAWYLGSGPLTSLVCEGSLKMMELTNGDVVAGHSNSAEFRHGPKTVINPKTMTIHFISGNDFTAKYDVDLLKELYSQRDGNRVVAIFADGKEDITNFADLSVPYFIQNNEGNHCDKLSLHICVGMQGLVFMQMLSMFTSLALNVTTDNPSPDGLVNRVVQGVTVYPYED